jgi:hypothetical protein
MNAQAFADYLTIDAVNWSTLKELRRSPLHYRYRLENPRADTRLLRAGRTNHTAVFEPDRFLLEYVVFDHENKGGKVVRNGNAWEAFKAAHANKTILTPTEYAAALAVRDAARNCELAKPYLRKGRAEFAIQWRDPLTGLQLKARIDWLSDSKPAILDLKTTGSITYNALSWTSYKLAHHCQLGFYQWGIKEALGLDVPVKVLAVELGEPHDATVLEYGEDELETGRNEAQALLVKLAEHRSTDRWPGQYTEELVLQFPPSVTRHDDENVSELGLED